MQKAIMLKVAILQYNSAVLVQLQ